MGAKKAVAQRLQEICTQKQLSVNALANLAGITPSTVYSALDPTRKDIGIIVIKKLCDGLEITLGEFFQTEAFDSLEQELK